MLRKLLRSWQNGYSTWSAYNIPDEASPDSSGFLGDRGTLRTLAGDTRQFVLPQDTPSCRLWRYYRTGHAVNNTTATTQNSWTVVRGTTALWFHDGATVRPLATNRATMKDSFAQFGGYLYCTDGTQNLRWTGNYYCLGTVRCGGTNAVTGTNVSWAGKSSIRKGDAVYFKTGSTWGTHTYRVATIISATHMRLTTTGPSMVVGKEYVTARVHQMGLQTPGTMPALAQGTAAAGMATGAYYYKFAYYNSQVAIESNASSTTDTSYTSAANKRDCDVSGWPTAGLDMQIDQIRVYRSKVGTTTPLFLTGTVPRTGTGYKFATTHRDVVRDSALGSDAPKDENDRPVAVEFLQEFNQRLYGVASNSHILRFSNLGAPEYWPTSNYGIDSPTASQGAIGGIVAIGDGVDEAITAAIPEGGAYQVTGNAGSNLLVFTRNRARRWFGTDWSDFYRADAFNTGCIARRTALNCGGFLAWLSYDGVVGLMPASNMVAPLYQPVVDLVPQGAASWSDACATYWRDFYVLSGWYRTGSSAEEGILLHLPSKAWYPVWVSGGSLAARDLITIQGPGDAGQLWLAEGASGYVSEFLLASTGALAWRGASGMVCDWRTKIMDLGGEDPEGLYSIKQLQRIVICFQRPLASQTVTVSVYTNGETTTAAWSETVTVAATGTADKRTYVVLHPVTVSGRGFQIRVDGTFTRQTVIEWIEVTAVAQTQKQGVAVG